jgi:hypothetical protein
LLALLLTLHTGPLQQLELLPLDAFFEDAQPSLLADIEGL